MKKDIDWILYTLVGEMIKMHNINSVGNDFIGNNSVTKRRTSTSYYALCAW
jgi:hypothetical protein